MCGCLLVFLLLLFLVVVFLWQGWGIQIAFLKISYPPSLSLLHHIRFLYLSPFTNRESIIPDNLGFAITIIRVCRLRERGRMSKSVYVCVFHDLELLRYVLRCAIERQL